MNVIVEPEDLKRYTSKSWEELPVPVREYIRILEDNRLRHLETQRKNLMKSMKKSNSFLWINKLIENEKENLNLDNKDSAIRSVPASVENSTQTKGAEMGSPRVLPGRLVERLEAAKAESNRRIAAAAELRQKYNIDENGNISADDLLRMFEDFTDNKDDIELLKSIMDNTSNLGIDFKFNYKLSSAKGAASAIKKTVEYNMDSFNPIILQYPNSWHYD